MQKLIMQGKKEFYLICIYMTPLHIAVKYGYSDVAEYLLDRGAKVNKPNIVLKENIFFFS